MDAQEKCILPFKNNLGNENLFLILEFKSIWLDNITKVLFEATRKTEL